MISAEFSLSTRILLVLNPSIMSMMTTGLPCGYFTPLVSSSKKTMSDTSLLLFFLGGIMSTLLTYLCCDFLRDLNEPPIVGPSLIILISPTALFGRSCDLSSSLGFSSNLVRSSYFGRPYVFFLTNFYNLPFWINSSVCSLRSLHSLV